jgi:glycerol-3-phosphate acyltransferase PlsY
MNTQLLSFVLLIIWLISCYSIGTIQSGDIVSYKKHVDIRQIGSKNPGASNIYANIGAKYGILVFFIDISKGLIPTAIPHILGYPYWVSALSMFVLLAGHMIRLPYKITGGTGMATAMGSVVGLAPIVAIGTAIPSAIVLLITKSPVYAGVFAFLTATISSWIIYKNFILTCSILIVGALIMLKIKSQYKNID